jgi:hypothetical protein
VSDQLARPGTRSNQWLANEFGRDVHRFRAEPFRQLANSLDRCRQFLQERPFNIMKRQLRMSESSSDAPNQLSIPQFASVTFFMETDVNPLLAGRCLCGAVHYAVKDEFVYALNCHCSNCRRATGSAFKSFAGIERDKLNITQGQGNLLIFGDENAAHDVHCNTCGSLMFSVVRGGEFVHVTLGTLEDTPAIRPTAHIFVASKAAWYSITDELPQHDEFG